MESSCHLRSTIATATAGVIMEKGNAGITREDAAMEREKDIAGEKGIAEAMKEDAAKTDAHDEDGCRHT